MLKSSSINLNGKQRAFGLFIIGGVTLLLLLGFIPVAKEPALAIPLSTASLNAGCLPTTPFTPTTQIYLPFVATASTGSGGLKLQPPDDGVYHAAFPGFVTEDEEPAPATGEKIEEFEMLAGKEIVWAYFNNEWTEGIIFPKEDICTIHNSGKTPFVRLMPRNRDTEFKELLDCEAPVDFEPAYKMQDFIDGDYDDELRQWAREAKATGVSILAEFGPEVNGCWMSWNGMWHGGGQMNGYGDPTVADGPERFRDAHQRVVDLFRQEGADNVTWFFHITYGDNPNDEWNRFNNYYPGDDVIDWIGISVYGAQTPCDNTWYTFAEQFQAMYEAVDDQESGISSDKPMAILELGVVEGHPDGSKPAWIEETLTKLSNGSYPRVKGFSWWHERWTNSDCDASDIRIDSSTETQTSYREGVAADFFVSEANFARTPPVINP